jgi:hypothetical protein
MVAVARAVGGKTKSRSIPGCKAFRSGYIGKAGLRPGPYLVLSGEHKFALAVKGRNGNRPPEFRFTPRKITHRIAAPHPQHNQQHRHYATYHAPGDSETTDEAEAVHAGPLYHRPWIARRRCRTLKGGLYASLGFSQRNNQ